MLGWYGTAVPLLIETQELLYPFPPVLGCSEPFLRHGTREASKKVCGHFSPYLSAKSSKFRLGSDHTHTAWQSGVARLTFGNTLGAGWRGRGLQRSASGEQKVVGVSPLQEPALWIVYPSHSLQSAQCGAE